MSTVARCFLTLIRQFGAARFARTNRAQLGYLHKGEKDELWAALTEDEKRQIRDALRDEHD
jgi:hypothetical protein